jgi:phage tail tape-measure protein
MANRLTTEILINLAGNLTAKARQYGANMSEFARTNQRAMSVVKPRRRRPVVVWMRWAIDIPP